MTDVPSIENGRMKKYKQAAWMFTGMNLLYLVITFFVMPPVGLDPFYGVMFCLVAVVLSGGLSLLIARQGRKLAMSLALIYAGRIGVSVYTLIAGTAFPIVPWVLSTVVIAFYYLGRAAWDWP
ncbi:MAG: hypothetical protein G3M70_10210 [Candidatus Nitronauta litoralis]|uniref:Uncharacterized protein n=1 Tax=Candidatus Nitronauta litoralis TaxID=2705533 RepID=A0A7T0G0S3_9BACT|nr:MAG: hypothetical protein G3M70_10210 [Candidatus Nitronauta litoralis]